MGDRASAHICFDTTENHRKVAGAATTEAGLSFLTGFHLQSLSSSSRAQWHNNPLRPDDPASYNGTIVFHIEGEMHEDLNIFGHLSNKY